jgi:hypothetical protein
LTRTCSLCSAVANIRCRRFIICPSSIGLFERTAASTVRCGLPCMKWAYIKSRHASGFWAWRVCRSKIPKRWQKDEIATSIPCVRGFQMKSRRTWWILRPMPR